MGFIVFQGDESTTTKGEVDVNFDTNPYETSAITFQWVLSFDNHANILANSFPHFPVTETYGYIVHLHPERYHGHVYCIDWVRMFMPRENHDAFVKAPWLCRKDSVNLLFGVEREKDEVISDELHSETRLRSPKGIERICYGIRVYRAPC